MDIKKLDRNALKSFFVKNAIPTEGNFKDLIDGMINQKEDGIVKLPDNPLSLQADSYASSQKVINFYRDFADSKPAWTLSLNPYVDPSEPLTARPGWSIDDADGNSRLFIDQKTGNVGIGTANPASTLNIRKDAAGALGPVLSLTNASGERGAGAAIDFSGNDTQNQPPAARIHSVADERFSGHLIFSTKKPGAAANELIEVLRLTSEGNVGIGTPGSTTAKLDVNGIVRVTGGFNSARDPDSAMTYGGSLVIKNNGPQIDFINTDHNDWSIHVNRNKMYFVRQPWESQDLVLDGAGKVGIGTESPEGKLHVQTGGDGGWDKFVVKATNLWGDGNNHVTIGSGATGIMLYNPHVVWYAQEGRASIRMGRSGGVKDGHWWDIGVRAGNLFSIRNGEGVRNAVRGFEALVIDGGGNVSIGSKDNKLTVPGELVVGQLKVDRMWVDKKEIVGSELRLKKDVGPLIRPPENILRLRGVRFKWQDAAEDDPYAIGLLAQEVEEFFPEAVGTGPDGMKGINYGALIAPLIETLKQQQSQIGELRMEIEALRAR
jgi:hypothetical protein